MRGMKTVGILRELPEEKIVEIGVPVGVVAAILPTTNPTSTAIYKTLISLKAGNAIVISPHPRAHRCTCETAAILYQAALEAGAPEDIIQCVDTATMEGTNALMRHERTGVILATGGARHREEPRIRAASRRSASDRAMCRCWWTPRPTWKTPSRRSSPANRFDYGTVCSSEQAIVAEYSLRDRIIGAAQSSTRRTSATTRRRTRSASC